MRVRLRGVEGRWVRFVVLRMLRNSVSLVGRVLINPSMLVLIAGEEPIAQVYLRVKTKIRECNMHGKDMLGRLILMLQYERFRDFMGSSR